MLKCSFSTRSFASLQESEEEEETQEVADSLVDDFVITESASAVEVAIAESAVVQPVRATQETYHDITKFFQLASNIPQVTINLAFCCLWDQ